LGHAMVHFSIHLRFVTPGFTGDQRRNRLQS
jgi:hypothetical protein